MDVDFRELGGFVEERDGEVAGEYADVISGELDRRPEVDRLRADAFSRRFNTVCVWRVDRLGRSPQHAFNLHAWFRDYHIDFISLKEQIDTTTPQGMFFFGVCVLFAQWEQACRSERTKLGLAGARAWDPHRQAGLGDR